MKKSKKRKVTRKKSNSALVIRRKKIVAPPIGLLGTEKLFSPIRERVSCGCATVDAIMGGPMTQDEAKQPIPVPYDGTTTTQWGVPVGHIIEIVGEYSTGKTTWLEILTANVQRLGGDCYMGITEMSLDPERAMRIGVLTDKVHYKEFEFIEDGFEWIKAIIAEKQKDKKNDRITLITWDSVGASHSKDERPGSGGRVMREGLREVTSLIARNRAILVFTNHVSATFNRFETEPATPFGQGVRYHATIRLEFKGQKKFDQLESLHTAGTIYSDSSATTGIMPVVLCRKNKSFPPNRRCRMPVTFRYGVDDDFAMYLYLCDRTRYMTTSPPKEGERGDMGAVITFHMPEPAACYAANYRNFINNERPDVKKWMVAQCRLLAYNDHNPIQC